MTQHPVFCGKDCGGGACPLVATVEDGRVVRIAHNPAGDGYAMACSRGLDLALETYAPDRILKPLVRTGTRGSGQFRVATWDEALGIVAGRLATIRDESGPDAVLNLGSAGSLGALQNTSALLRRFFAFFGGCTSLSGGYSNAAARFALPYALGEDWMVSGFDASTMRYSKMIVLWGANVLEARLGAEIPARLMEAKNRGATIVVIDPRNSATARRAGTSWIPVKPGTDAALMLAILHVLFSEGLADRDFIAGHSVGFDELERYVLGRADTDPVGPGHTARGDSARGNSARGRDAKEGDRIARSPEWAEGVCGVPAADIRKLAREWASARPAMLLPGFSIQRVFAGEESYRLSVALQVATGNFGRLGGSTGSLNNRLPTPPVGRMQSPNLPGTVTATAPASRWPDAVLEGRRGGYPSDIRAIYCAGCNFLNQGADIRKNLAAFGTVDFVVAQDFFMTPTARWSDVILPAATALEKEDIGIPWLGNYLLYKPRVVSPLGLARDDYDILGDLAGRLGFGAGFTEGRSASEWIRRFIAESEIDDPEAFMREGIYRGKETDRVGLSDFAADPERFPLKTPSGKIEIASEAYVRDSGYCAIPTWREAPRDPEYPLLLVTPKSPHRTHSQWSSIAGVRQKADHALEMHLCDAQPRGIADGDEVFLFNGRGRSRVKVRLVVDMAPGIVCLHEGVWYEPDGDGVDLAASANMFTSSEGTEASSACVMHAIGVEVSAVGNAGRT